ncbi:25733_t:CDS:2, partial [Gigaspora rosea]
MVEWTDSQIRILIDEHRNRNNEYHDFGRNRIRFWDSIVTRINQKHNTSFNGYQCKEKFINLVRDYNLMCDYMAGNRRARRSQTGAQYFDEFRTHFWERPEDEFDRIRNINSSNRRRNRDVGNTTPVPSIEERPPPPIESLSPQPPPYSRGEDAIASGVTDEAQNNNQSQDSSNYEVAVSGSNLTPDLLNLSLSRNESDISMPDIGGSQPPSCMENINEEN